MVNTFSFEEDHVISERLIFVLTDVYPLFVIVAFVGDFVSPIDNVILSS